MALEKNLNEETAEEVAGLRAEVARLEREKTLLGRLGGNAPPPAMVEAKQQLMNRVGELEERLSTVEEENQDFAKLLVEVQEQNEAITNLYVASHRVHATLDAGEVIDIIKEILIELVGAEEFGILLLDKKKNRLELMVSEGARERLPAESVPAGDGVIGEVASTGEPFFFEPKTPREQDAGLPLAAIPLQVNESSVGVIVIYKLLGQKLGFSPIDHQLLELLAAHAATALLSASLHSAMDRRLKTVEGFVQLMKPS